MTSEDFLEKDINVVTSCFLGSNFERPKILSSLNETFVPEKSFTIQFPGESKVTCENQAFHHSFELDLKSTEIPDFQCLDLIYMAFELPELIACSATAQAGYCDLPALNIFQNFKISIANQVTETLTPISLNLALKDHFKDNYSYWANKWLGGLNGPNQKLSKCELYRNAPNNKEVSQNIIKNKIKCLVPLKFHIFRNKNLKNLLTNQKITISFALSSYVDCIIHNNYYTPIKHSFVMDFYGQAITSDVSVFNNMSHTIPTEAYLELDECFETNPHNKILPKTSDFILNLNSKPTTQYWAQLSPSNFSKKNLYLGETTEKAIKNYWAAMFKIKTPTSDIDSLIELNKQEFTTSNLMKNNKKTQYTIKKVDTKSFAIVFSTDTRQDPYEILISFSIELSSFPDDFCLDLFHYTNSSPFVLKPEYFSAVHFEFEKFDKYNHLHNEDINTFTLNIIDVPSYYFSFQASDGKYVFKEVNSIQKSLTITQTLIDIAASMPTTMCETRVPFSPVAAKSFVYLKKPYWPYYDLSGKIPIEVSHYKIGNDITSNVTLELEKQIKDCCEFTPQEFQLSKRISYRTVNNKSYGFEIPNPTSVEFILKELSFTFDPKETQVYDLPNFLLLNLVQTNLKHFKYINNSIKYFKNSDYSVMATEVLSKDIGENGRFSDFHVYQEEEEEDNSDLISITKKRKKVLDEFPAKIKNIKSNAINSINSIVTFNKRR